MRYRDLVLDKVQKIENLFGTLNLSVSRGEQQLFETTIERMKDILGEIYRFVEVENQED